jgi:hypothetical protein
MYEPNVASCNMRQQISKGLPNKGIYHHLKFVTAVAKHSAAWPNRHCRPSGSLCFPHMALLQLLCTPLSSFDFAFKANPAWHVTIWDIREGGYCSITDIVCAHQVLRMLLQRIVAFLHPISQFPSLHLTF